MLVTLFARLNRGWFKDRVAGFVRDMAGATAIEYSLIAALISVAIVGGVTTFSTQLTAGWSYLASTVNPQLGH
jgi:pilus assembly protein Flp/PilA